MAHSDRHRFAIEEQAPDGSVEVVGVGWISSKGAFEWRLAAGASPHADRPHRLVWIDPPSPLTIGVEEFSVGEQVAIVKEMLVVASRMVDGDEPVLAPLTHRFWSAGRTARHGTHRRRRLER
jgi:hypothetical protein